MAFAKIHAGITDSSINEEELHVRWLWVVMLTKANADGNVFGTLGALARAANIPLKDAVDAMGVLTSPDPGSTSAAEGGRRVVSLEGNQWFIVNHEYYRDEFNYQKQKTQGKERQKKFRSKRKTNESLPSNDAVTDCNDIQSADGIVQSTDDNTHKSVFLDWWARWPSGRKIDKAKCMRHFNRLNNADKENATGPAYQAWLDHWVTTDVQFIPHPMTWLNNRRWEAGPPKQKSNAANHQQQGDKDEMEIEHKKSCENANKLLQEIATSPEFKDLMSELSALNSAIITARNMPPGEGYQHIVNAEDFLLDSYADLNDIDAKTAIERRRLAREKTGLPVLY